MLKRLKTELGEKMQIKYYNKDNNYLERVIEFILLSKRATRFTMINQKFNQLLP